MKEELRKIIDGLSDREICDTGIFRGIVNASTETVEDIRNDLYNMFENVEEFESWLNDKEIDPSCY